MDFQWDPVDQPTEPSALPAPDGTRPPCRPAAPTPAAEVSEDAFLRSAHRRRGRTVGRPLWTIRSLVTVWCLIHRRARRCPWDAPPPRRLGRLCRRWCPPPMRAVATRGRRYPANNCVGTFRGQPAPGRLHGRAWPPPPGFDGGGQGLSRTRRRRRPCRRSAAARPRPATWLGRADADRRVHRSLTEGPVPVSSPAGFRLASSRFRS